jgi:hypothetical protein
LDAVELVGRFQQASVDGAGHFDRGNGSFVLPRSYEFRLWRDAPAVLAVVLPTDLTNGAEPFGRLAQIVCGAIGGILPFAIPLIRAGSLNISAPLPQFGGFYILAVLLSIALGVLASLGFRAHNVLAAVYHGATAPITLAFAIGLDIHAK